MSKEYPIPFVESFDESETKTGYRQAQALAVLEIFEGKIISPSPAKTIKQEWGMEDTRGAEFSKIIKSLVRRELIREFKVENEPLRGIELTDQGYEKIVELKTYRDSISLQKEGRGLEFGTGCRIIEYILEESVETDENGTSWLLNTRSDGTKATLDIVTALEGYATEEAVQRRLTALHDDLGYIDFVVQETVSEDGSVKTIINIGVTKAGKDYYNRVVDEVFGNSEDLQLKDSVNDVIHLATLGMEYANSLNDRNLLKEFMAQSSAYDLTEMDQLQLTRRRHLVEEMLQDAKLRVQKQAA